MRRRRDARASPADGRRGAVGHGGRRGGGPRGGAGVARGARLRPEGGWVRARVAMRTPRVAFLALRLEPRFGRRRPNFGCAAGQSWVGFWHICATGCRMLDSARPSIRVGSATFGVMSAKFGLISTRLGGTRFGQIWLGFDQAWAVSFARYRVGSKSGQSGRFPEDGRSGLGLAARVRVSSSDAGDEGGAEGPESICLIGPGPPKAPSPPASETGGFS